MTKQRTLQESIAEQRDILSKMLCDPLKHAAQVCAAAWGDRQAMNDALLEILKTMPYCKFLYTLDTDAIQISDNVSHDGLIQEDFGRDRSSRPYMNEVVPSTDFVLSGAYISLRAKRPSLTAIQIVRTNKGQALGFVGANVIVEYRHIGLGMAGNPAGPDIDPLITVRLRDLRFAFMGLAFLHLPPIVLPDFRASMTAEDGRSA